MGRTLGKGRRMSNEKAWEAIAPRLFSANGKQNGEAPLVNARGFKVGMIVYLSSNTLVTPEIFKVKRVIDNSVYLGSVNKGIGDRADLSAYLVTDNATLWANEQLSNMSQLMLVELWEWMS
jgi:hypothetical protein